MTCGERSQEASRGAVQALARTTKGQVPRRQMQRAFRCDGDVQHWRADGIGRPLAEQELATASVPDSGGHREVASVCDRRSSVMTHARTEASLAVS